MNKEICDECGNNMVGRAEGDCCNKCGCYNEIWEECYFNKETKEFIEK